jgi:hypothetical protein
LQARTAENLALSVSSVLDTRSQLCHLDGSRPPQTQPQRPVALLLGRCLRTPIAKMPVSTRGRKSVLVTVGTTKFEELIR